jgi:hypothetical protein
MARFFTKSEELASSRSAQPVMFARWSEVCVESKVLPPIHHVLDRAESPTTVVRQAGRLKGRFELASVWSGMWLWRSIWTWPVHFDGRRRKKVWRRKLWPQLHISKALYGTRLLLDGYWNLYGSASDGL